MLTSESIELIRQFRANEYPENCNADLYIEIAHRQFRIPYDQVTQEMRQQIKSAAYIYMYSVSEDSLKTMSHPQQTDED